MRRWQRVGVATMIAMIAALLRPRRAGEPTADGDVAQGGKGHVEGGRDG